ncbi:MAG: 50S ribosomal protein L1, partial [Hyphomicrobium sp.]
MAQKMSAEAIKATRLAGGKRLAAARQGVSRNKYYTIDEAVKLLKGRATAKFDETVEVAMNLGVDPKHAD